MTTLQPCGTQAAFYRHKRNGEEPCQACRAAKARYNADYRRRVKNGHTRTRRAYTVHEQQLALRLIREGLTAYEIAPRVGTNRQYVYRLAKRHGLTVNQRPRQAATTSLVDEATALLAAEPGPVGEEWMFHPGKHCAGRDPEDFYPRESAGSRSEMQQVCRGCPVQAQCLRYAIDRNENWGVWGGLSPRQRRRVSRRLREEGQAS